MNAKARQARRTIRQRATDTRAQNRATRAVATGRPQTARTHLLAAGLSDTDARRFAGAFSRSVLPTATTETVVKLKGRVTKTVPVKLYDRRTFVARLAVYRPKDRAAAARFERLALAA
jgi:hypothetical protein